jgi:hypothetical protein
MAYFRHKAPQGLNYLGLKPKKVNWRVVAGPRVSYIQSYDLVFDEFDCKIRQL